MAFNFPDPNVTTEFTAANGITYSWDAIDSKWQIKRYAADLDDRYVNEDGDTMTGDLIVNATVHADTVETLVVDSGENSNLVLKHDGNTKVYVGGSQVTIQNPLKLNTEGTDDDHAVTKKYIDDIKADFTLDQQRQDDDFALDQQRQDAELAAEIQAREERDLLHDAEINTLEYKLDALIGVTFRGTYEFKHEADCDASYQSCVSDCLANDPQDQGCRDMCAQTLKDCESQKVRPGYFEAVDPDDRFDHLEQIVISKSDKSSVEIDWANVLKKDDYLEVDHVLAGQLDKTNYGLYRILEDPEEGTNAFGEEVYTMKLQFLQGDGVMNENELYEIRGITAAEGVNPEELGDFLTKDQAAALYTTKPYVDKAVVGSPVSAGRKFQGTSGYPSGESYFVTDDAQPGRVTKIYMHPDFIDRHFDGPGKTFRSGGWIYIYDTSGYKETMGMYFVYNLNTDSNGYKYFSVHGMGSNRNLITGTNYGMGFAVSFDS